LKAATHLLYKHGYSGTNLDDIAEMLDFSKASLYHYFPSKEALVICCLERIGDETNERLTAVIEGNSSPLERLHAAIKAQVLLLIRDPAGTSLFLHDLGLPEAVQERLRALVDRHDRLFRTVIDEGVNTGEILLPNSAVTRLLMHGAINLIPTWYREANGTPPEHLAELVADTLLRLFEDTKT
jgi:AcrR family transcriptional regulator